MIQLDFERFVFVSGLQSSANFVIMPSRPDLYRLQLILFLDIARVSERYRYNLAFLFAHILTFKFETFPPVIDQVWRSESFPKNLINCDNGSSLQDRGTIKEKTCIVCKGASTIGNQAASDAIWIS